MHVPFALTSRILANVCIASRNPNYVNPKKSNPYIRKYNLPQEQAQNHFDWSYSLSYHLEDLEECLFAIDDSNITVNPKETYIGFPDVKVFGKYVGGYATGTV